MPSEPSSLESYALSPNMVSSRPQRRHNDRDQILCRADLLNQLSHAPLTMQMVNRDQLRIGSPLKRRKQFSFLAPPGSRRVTAPMAGCCRMSPRATENPRPAAIGKV